MVGVRARESMDGCRQTRGSTTHQPRERKRGNRKGERGIKKGREEGCLAEGPRETAAIAIVARGKKGWEKGGPLAVYDHLR